MNLLIVALLGLFVGTIYTSPTPISRNNASKENLLGSKECTWGPGYWCSNITNAKNCGAVKHCIQTVWEHQTVPEDNDNMCTICKDMVQQARDQLESNQTQEDLKEVFEGSCRLIHVKPVVKECIKVVDDFIPELVEALASQMNPSVVCSVAGLCNSARIDKMLEEYAASKPETPLPVVSTKALTCDGCFNVVDKMTTNFNSLQRDDVLQGMLEACGRMGSFSDACSSIIITNFNPIYVHMQSHFNSENVCHMSGVCSERYHTHEDKKVEITPLSAVGVVEVQDDDLPCELCQQLVNHLKDVLVANTTELEFKQVMEGICKQTKSFAEECLSLVDQYYGVIYSFLVNNLDNMELCFMAGICPKGGKLTVTPIWPLLAPDTAQLAIKTMSQRTEPKFSASEINDMQLPVSRLIPQTIIDHSSNTQWCTFCEYFLHFVQETISTPKNEDAIKKAVSKACDKLPKTVNGECRSFVDIYGDAFIALLIQEVDPSQVCPAMHLCPSKSSDRDVEIIMHSGVSDKPSCAMCLLAMTDIEEVVKNDKTEASIESALDNLCIHLSPKLRDECTDFVATYARELIDMLIADFTPQEVCVYIKLCSDPKYSSPMLPEGLVLSAHVPLVSQNKDDEIMTNDIPDNTVNGIFVSNPVVLPVKKASDTPQCVICEFIMTQLENELKDKKTDEDIKNAVRNVCKILPASVKGECNQFIDQYGDFVIALLIQSLSPKQVCDQLGLCVGKKMESVEEVAECAVCEGAVVALEKLLDNPTVDKDIVNVLGKVCHAVPAKRYNQCKQMIKVYGASIIHLVESLTDSREVCAKIGLCFAADQYGTFVEVTNSRSERSSEELLGSNKCTWGPSYWCENTNQANDCGAIKHCQDKVWLGAAPSAESE